MLYVFHETHEVTLKVKNYTDIFADLLNTPKLYQFIVLWGRQECWII